MPPPESGYGPVNYARPGSIDPFAAFDNRIRYNDMIRQQMVSQYQQSTVQPKSMTLGMQRHVAQDPRFQYGVPGGQDPRHYQRQAQLRQMGVGTAIAKTAMDIGAWEAGAGVAAGLKAVGMGFFGSGIAVPAIAAGAALYMPMRGISNAMERQSFMHGMAADIEQYRDTLGFSGGLSYKQTTNLAGRMQRNMYQGGFFNKDQQSQIHKIALSNNMISAKGSGATAGTMRQYEKNFEDLKETTEEVVKLMQTTIEGGMSVIKELQQTGFGTMRQVKQQVRQAKAFGGITGMGAQNMMLQGAAGAQAVQGTPWAANVGATMYQTGAAQASYMSRMGSAGAYAVQRVGGVAAAGGVLANAQMNVLSSGMGTKAVAYTMSADGTVDQDRMARLMGGKVGAYEMVVGASQRGYAMGISGRVLFERNKEDALNNMSDMGRTQMTNKIFQAWGRGRFGNVEAKAWAFAGQFTNDQRSQRLFAENLTRPKGFDEQFGGMQETRATLTQPSVKRPLGPVGRAVVGTAGAIGGAFDMFGEDVVYQSGRAIGGLSKAWMDIKKGAGGFVEDALQVAGIYDEYGGINRATTADPAAAIRNQYAMGVSASRAGMAQLAQSSPATIQRLRNIKKVDLNFNVGAMMRKDPNQLAYAYQQIGAAMNTGTMADIYRNDKVTRILGAAPGSEMLKLLQTNPLGVGNTFLGQANQFRTSVSKNYELATTEFDRIMTRLPKATQEKMLDMKLNARATYDLLGTHATNISIGKNKTQGIGTGAASDLVMKVARAEAEREGSEKMGAKFNEVSTNLEPFRKARREGIYGALGFEMEERVYASNKEGIVTKQMVETAATRRRKKGIKKVLGKEFRMDTPEAQMEVYEEIERLRETRDYAKLGKLAPILSGEKDANAMYFYSKGKGAWQDDKKAATTAIKDEQQTNAYKIRMSKAQRSIDTLEVGMGQKVTGKQKGFITDLLTEQLSPDQIKKQTRFGGKGIVNMLAGLTGTSVDVIKDQIKSGSLSRFVAGSDAAQTRQDTSNGVDKARSDLAEWQDRKRLLDNTNKGFIKEDGEKIKAKQINMELLKAQEEYDKLRGVTPEMAYPTSSRDKTAYASVQPPILNYWNNKWTL